MEQLKSISKIFMVLETLCTHGDLGVSELSVKLKIGKSSIHRFLSFLTEMGYVNQNPNTHKYFATLKLFEIGAMVRGRNRLVNISRPYMEELGNKFHETINLAFLEDGEVVYVDKVESIQALRMDLAIGHRVPAYCTALGKVFLAFLRDREIEQYCQKTRFKPLSEKTITSAKELVKHLKTIREEGIAIDDGELDNGIRCIAAPIRDDSGKVIGAISLAGPTIRLTMERLKSVKQPLLEATKNISQKLGYIKL
jgi:IclR family transcriptional regulator, KDG regulon repressor